MEKESKKVSDSKFSIRINDEALTIDLTSYSIYFKNLLTMNKAIMIFINL